MMESRSELPVPTAEEHRVEQAGDGGFCYSRCPGAVTRFQIQAPGADADQMGPGPVSAAYGGRVVEGDGHGMRCFLVAASDTQDPRRVGVSQVMPLRAVA